MRLMAEGVVALHSGVLPSKLIPKTKSCRAQLMRLMAEGVVAPHPGTLPS